MLAAMGSHNQEVLDSVVAPGAVYFAGFEAEEKKQSAPLSLDSFQNIRGRCHVSSVSACGRKTATIKWFCPSATKDTNIWSRVHLDDAGKITSAIGDAAPVICQVPVPSR